MLILKTQKDHKHCLQMMEGLSVWKKQDHVGASGLGMRLPGWRDCLPSAVFTDGHLWSCLRASLPHPLGWGRVLICIRWAQLLFEASLGHGEHICWPCMRENDSSSLAPSSVILLSRVCLYSAYIFLLPWRHFFKPVDPTIQILGVCIIEMKIYKYLIINAQDLSIYLSLHPSIQSELFELLKCGNNLNDD